MLLPGAAVAVLVLGVATAVTSATTPVSVHLGDNATFSWPLPASARGKLVLVVRPTGARVLSWAPDCTVTPFSDFADRVRSSCKDASQVTFTLLGVRWSDEGSYTCEAVSSFSSPRIEDCGQELTVFKDRPFPQPEVSHYGMPVLGQPFSMSCECTRGCPHPEHILRSQWFKDSVELPETSLVLSIPHVTEQDDGAYTCRIIGSRPETTSPVSLRVNFVVLYSPQVHMEVTTTDAVAGEAYLTLTCVVTAAFPDVPKDGYSWSYLPSPQGQLRPLVGKTRTLTLGPLTRKDGGQYFCQARNDEGFQWTRIPPGNTSFTLTMSCINVKLGMANPSQLLLQRDGHGYRAIFEVPWYDGSIVIQHPNTSFITYWHPPCHFDVTAAFQQRVTNMSCDPCKRTLSFSLSSLTERDLGRYQCYAGTTHGTKLDSCSMELIIKVSPQVYIKPVTPDAVVKETEGKYLTLTCVVTEAFPHVPEDGYSWSYLPSPQGQLRPLVGKTSTLTLGPVTREDRGQYFCQARSDQIFEGMYIPPGNASFTLTMSCIDDLLRPIIPSQTLVQREGDGYIAMFEIAQYTALILIQHPNTYIITDWHPPCHFDITAAFQHRVTNTFCDPCKRTLSFSLSSLTESDLGWYQCYVGSVHGTKVDSCSVEVISKVHIEPATPDAVVKETEGKYLTLTCVVTEAFPPVPEDGYSWSYLPSPQGQLRPLVGKTSTLTLGPVTREDRGQYFCQARNDRKFQTGRLPPGNASFTLTRSCIDALLGPIIVSQAHVERAEDGYRAVFKIALHPGLMLIQHPDSSIITDWHPPCHFNVTAAFQQRATNTSCDPCKRTLSFSLSSLTERDLGWYQCYAGTTHGTMLDSCSVELVAKTPLQVHIEPVTPDAVVEETEGKYLTLTCVVTEAFPPVPKDGYSWSYLPSPQGQLRHLVGKTRTLTLGPVTREDRGQYFCQASNDQDNRWNLPPGNASVTVDVSFLGRIISTSNLEVNKGDYVTLTCSVESNPAAHLAWVVEGQEVRHVTANVDHYVVERAACSDSKTHTCRASNPDLPGLERNTSTTLTVNCGQADTSHEAQVSPMTIAALTLTSAVLLVVIIVTAVFVMRRQSCRKLPCRETQQLSYPDEVELRQETSAHGQERLSGSSAGSSSSVMPVLYLARENSDFTSSQDCDG